MDPINSNNSNIDNLFDPPHIESTFQEEEEIKIDDDKDENNNLCENDVLQIISNLQTQTQDTIFNLERIKAENKKLFTENQHLSETLIQTRKRQSEYNSKISSQFDILRDKEILWDTQIQKWKAFIREKDDLIYRLEQKEKQRTKNGDEEEACRNQSSVVRCSKTDDTNKDTSTNQQTTLSINLLNNEIETWKQKYHQEKTEKESVQEEFKQSVLLHKKKISALSIESHTRDVEYLKLLKEQQLSSQLKNKAKKRNASGESNCNGEAQEEGLILRQHDSLITNTSKNNIHSLLQEQIDSMQLTIDTTQTHNEKLQQELTKIYDQNVNMEKTYNESLSKLKKENTNILFIGREKDALVHSLNLQNKKLQSENTFLVNHRKQMDIKVQELRESVHSKDAVLDQVKSKHYSDITELKQSYENQIMALTLEKDVSLDFDSYKKADEEEIEIQNSIDQLESKYKEVITNSQNREMKTKSESQKIINELSFARDQYRQKFEELLQKHRDSIENTDSSTTKIQRLMEQNDFLQYDLEQIKEEREITLFPKISEKEKEVERLKEKLSKCESDFLLSETKFSDLQKQKHEEEEKERAKRCSTTDAALSTQNMNNSTGKENFSVSALNKIIQKKNTKIQKLGSDFSREKRKNHAYKKKYKKVHKEVLEAKEVIQSLTNTLNEKAGL